MWTGKTSTRAPVWSAGVTCSDAGLASIATQQEKADAIAPEPPKEPGRYVTATAYGDAVQGSGWEGARALPVHANHEPIGLVIEISVGTVNI